MNEAAPDLLDEQLWKARAGDPAGLAALIRAHQRSVYSLALRMLGTKDLAEDLSQEVFMSLSTHLHSVESNKHLGFWLRKVTSRRAIDQLRRRSRFEMTALPTQDTLLFSTEDHADPMWQRHLGLLLLDLSPPARAVLLLRYQEDLDPTEIAETLDMSINTVKTHLQRSLQALRRQLADVRGPREESSQ